MNDDSHLYLDVDTLKDRGWTESLIKRFLGDPDRWDTVSHWANFTGKRTYFLERVEFAEGSSDFKESYSKSLRRRKINKKTAQGFISAREVTSNDLKKWRESLSDGDIKISPCHNGKIAKEKERKKTMGTLIIDHRKNPRKLPADHPLAGTRIILGGRQHPSSKTGSTKAPQESSTNKSTGDA